MKDTYYFAHDYNARTDTKMQELLMTFGVAGIGIYWCVIEQLYEQGGRLPLTAVRSMAFSLHADEETVRSVVCDFGLFENDGTEFWSESASRRIEKMESVRRRRQEATSAAMRRRWAKERAKEVSEAVAEEDMSHTEDSVVADISHICNIDDDDISHIIIKENKIKENKIKENKIKENKIKENKIKENIVVTSPSPPQFVKPSIEDVRAYCSERGYTWDAEAFFDHYEANGWKVGGNPMKDWRAAVRKWNRGEPLKKNEIYYGSNRQRNGNRFGGGDGDGGYGDDGYTDTI